MVRVTKAPFTNHTGNIEEVLEDKQRVRVLMNVFGRATPVEFKYEDVEKLD